MASISIRVLTCDRCGRKDEIREAQAEYEWGVAGYSEINGYRHSTPDYRGSAGKDSDLCPECIKGLDEWWDLPKQKAPAPATKADEPFGRQRQGVHLTFQGAAADVDHYIRKIERFIDGQGDDVQRMGNQMKIHPRANND